MKQNSKETFHCLSNYYCCSLSLLPPHLHPSAQAPSSWSVYTACKSVTGLHAATSTQALNSSAEEVLAGFITGSSKGTSLLGAQAYIHYLLPRAELSPHYYVFIDVTTCTDAPTSHTESAHPVQGASTARAPACLQNPAQTGSFPHQRTDLPRQDCCKRPGF